LEHDCLIELRTALIRGGAICEGAGSRGGAGCVVPPIISMSLPSRYRQPTRPSHHRQITFQSRTHSTIPLCRTNFANALAWRTQSRLHQVQLRAWLSSRPSPRAIDQSRGGQREDWGGYPRKVLGSSNCHSQETSH
jgi:hypothetical protein